jgi:uncharacterized protein (DUF1810 family)
LTGPGHDTFGLQRFLDAQSESYRDALDELRAGAKRSHWMWFVFPQLRGLGHSSTAAFYGITSLEEARAYLAHPVLGERLRECVSVLLGLHGSDPEEVFGPTDAMKLRSCLTLFGAAAPGEQLFPRALGKYFRGEADQATLRLLR